MSEHREAAQSDLQDPPHRLGPILRRLGPGMIIAGSIVGSGELIATTKVGAEAGFWLLWLIIIGCAIKVFTQVEFGRHTITHSETPLKALDGVPGPRWRVNWVVWYWAVMTLLIVTQQGGIVGGIGQALTISQPLTEHGQRYVETQNRLVTARAELAELERAADLDDGEPVDTTDAARADRLRTLRQRVDEHTGRADALGEPNDPYLWAAGVAVITAVLLYVGRYGLIQAVATSLVAVFTLVTIVTLIVLQAKPAWAVTGADLGEGLSFRLPPVARELGQNPVATALAAFGIIGVGAAELIMYPYWCLEKGYARYTGRRDGTPQWYARARGWMRVLYTDAWLSMVVYTFATVAFYLLGAAVLGRSGLDVEKAGMVRTLMQMYVPVFGEWAPVVFLLGAFVVLYSTFFVAAAGNARMVADGLGLIGFHDQREATRMRWTRIIATLWALVAGALFFVVGLFLQGQSPAAMVLASGLAQAIMLPMLGVAALYFRYRRSDPQLRPGQAWDAMLWISFLGFLIAGVWIAYDKIT